MPQAWQHVFGGILEMGNWSGTNLSGAAEVAGEVPGVNSGGHGEVSAVSPS